MSSLDAKFHFIRTETMWFDSFRETSGRNFWSRHAMRAEGDLTVKERDQYFNSDQSRPKAIKLEGICRISRYLVFR
jgi:hypothetical protein